MCLPKKEQKQITSIDYKFIRYFCLNIYQKMNTLTLRKKLHNYIEAVEQDKLEAIYSIFKNDIEADSLLTLAQKKELDLRLDEYMNKKGKNYSWNEALTIIKPDLV